MAAPVGLEPTTLRLTGDRSAIELWGNTNSLNSGMGTAGIEPAYPGFQQQRYSQLSYIPNWRERRVLNPQSSVSLTDVFIQLHHVLKAKSSGLKPQLFTHLRSQTVPIAQSGYSPQLVGRAGVAPATQKAAVLQTVAHTDRRADLCLFFAAQS